MADTIITNSPDRKSGDSGAGWFVAVIVLVVVIIGGVLLYRNGVFNRTTAPAENNTTDINVTVPNPLPYTEENGGTEQPPQNP